MHIHVLIVTHDARRTHYEMREENNGRYVMSFTGSDTPIEGFGTQIMHAPMYDPSVSAAAINIGEPLCHATTSLGCPTCKTLNQFMLAFLEMWTPANNVSHAHDNTAAWEFEEQHLLATAHKLVEKRKAESRQRFEQLNMGVRAHAADVGQLAWDALRALAVARSVDT